MVEHDENGDLLIRINHACASDTSESVALAAAKENFGKKIAYRW